MMMPHCKSDMQHELFETAPPEAKATPKLALPFQRSAEIDVPRLCRILGVSEVTAFRMARAGLFRAYKVRTWRIEYNSVVEYCDQLRLQYRISGRTVARPTSGRMRDRDILPFPLDETIYMDEVTRCLDCSINPVTNLIQEGKLVAYKMIDRPGTPWRIYRPSFERYLASLHAEAKSPSFSSNSTYL